DDWRLPWSRPVVSVVSVISVISDFLLRRLRRLQRNIPECPFCLGFGWAQPTPTEENCGCPPRHGRSSFWGLGGACTRPRRRAGFGLSDHNTPQTALTQTTNDCHPNPREKGEGQRKHPPAATLAGLFSERVLATTNNSSAWHGTPGAHQHAKSQPANRARAWSTNPDWCTTHTRYRSTAT